MASIYLDYNATAPLRPEVAERITELLSCGPLNASSVHSHGRHAKKILEESRQKLAEIFGVFTRELMFTASASEANHMALLGFPERRLIVSAIEHSSVLSLFDRPFFPSSPRRQGPEASAQAAWDPRLRRNDEAGMKISVDGNGIISLSSLEAALTESPIPAIVSIMLANNETGVIQPIRDVAELCHEHGALLHVDAVQALGKIPFDFSTLQADLMTIAGHKCGGPVGAAALLIKDGLPLQPLFTGGGQELRRRAGTENIPAIAGFALAAELAQHVSHMKEIERWRDVMEAEVLQTTAEAVIFGKDTPRLPNTSCLAMPGVSQEVQLMHFDLSGIAVSAGSACSSGRIEPSHVLSAMGIEPELAGSAIRASAGWATKEEDFQKFSQSWKTLWHRRKSESR